MAVTEMCGPKFRHHRQEAAQLVMKPNAMLSRCRTTAVVRANRWDGSRLEHLVRPRFWLNHYGTITAHRSVLAPETKPLFTRFRETTDLYLPQRKSCSLLSPDTKPLFTRSREKKIFTCPREKAALYSLQRENRSLLVPRECYLLVPKIQMAVHSIQEKPLFIRFSTVPLFRGLTPC